MCIRDRHIITDKKGGWRRLAGKNRPHPCKALFPGQVFHVKGIFRKEGKLMLQDVYKRQDEYCVRGRRMLMQPHSGAGMCPAKEERLRSREENSAMNKIEKTKGVLAAAALAVFSLAGGSQALAMDCLLYTSRCV